MSPQGWRRWLGGAGDDATVAAGRFVEVLMRAPDVADAEWLGAHASEGDVDRAAWELRYARRALGLLIAEREALDDRTSRAVSRHLVEAIGADRQIAADMMAVASRQFNERLSAYREMLNLRGTKEGEARRLGRCLLILSGGVRFDGESLGGAETIIARQLHELRLALLAAFGEPALPDALRSTPKGTEPGG